MNAEKFIIKNKSDLLRIFGEVHSGMILDKIMKNIDDETFEKDCCNLTMVCKLYYNGEVDFPIDTSLFTEKDKVLSKEFYEIVKCENAVKDGFLDRTGVKYTLKNNLKKPKIILNKKYILPE